MTYEEFEQLNIESGDEVYIETECHAGIYNYDCYLDESLETHDSKGEIYRAFLENVVTIKRLTEMDFCDRLNFEIESLPTLDWRECPCIITLLRCM